LVGVRVLLAVPLLKRLGVVEPIVGAEVDDPGPGGQQMRGDRGRDPVRQAAKHAIGPRRDRHGVHIFQPQIQPPGERRMDRRHMRRSSCRLVSVVISTSGCRSSSLMSSRAVYPVAPKMATRVMVFQAIQAVNQADNATPAQYTGAQRVAKWG